MGDYAEKMSSNCMIVRALAPIDLAIGARNSVGMSMKFWDHCTVIAQTGLVGAADVTITLAQDVSVAWTSTDAIPLTYTTIYTNEAAPASSILLPVPVASTDILAVADAIYVIEVDADSLTDAMGVATGLPFDCIRVQLGGSAGATLVNVVCVFSQGRHTGAPATMKDLFID